MLDLKKHLFTVEHLFVLKALLLTFQFQTHATDNRGVFLRLFTHLHDTLLTPFVSFESRFDPAAEPLLF